MNPTQQPTRQPTRQPTLSVPSRWRRRTEPAPGVVVAARAPSLPPSGVRPELTLHRTAVGHDDHVRWREQALVELAGLLDDLAVEDDDAYDLDGRDVVYHRFAHRVGSADVLCDQWSWLTHGVGTTLTCSAARDDYLDYSEVFEAVAATVSPA
ncbi:hypothetical protein ABFT23_03985 [Nocardioides sp. C4-1]|uniref:hypothetical protein n=1 Tax=Nocardioides sp. C4-1 TaxID=3151851 RepID=UPI003266FA05